MGLVEMYNYYYHEMADSRVTGWPLMGAIWPNALIICSYIYFVFLFGPQFMKHRPAYKLTNFIRCYNIFQIVANAYVVHEMLAVYPDLTALRCVPGDYSLNPDAIRIAWACYYIVLLKAVDLIETGIFVLRKKQNQVSFLHVYHHISTFLIGLIFSRYISTGMAIFYPGLNCIVHVIMYSYYFLSNVEGIKGAVIPFKPYVTIIQMVQFVFLLLHAVVGLNPSCNVPKLPIIIVVPNVLMNFYLFYKFYKKTYLDPKKTK